MFNSMDEGHIRSENYRDYYAFQLRYLMNNCEGKPPLRSYVTVAAVINRIVLCAKGQRTFTLEAMPIML